MDVIRFKFCSFARDLCRQQSKKSLFHCFTLVGYYSVIFASKVRIFWRFCKEKKKSLIFGEKFFGDSNIIANFATRNCETRLRLGYSSTLDSSRLARALQPEKMKGRES